MMSIFELGVPQVVFWWIATLGVMAAGWVAFGGQHRNPQHDRELAWLVWHWFTGGPLDMTQAYPRGGRWPRRAVIRLGLAVARTAAAVAFMAAVHVQSGAGAGLHTVAPWAVGSVAVMSIAVFVVARVAVEWSMWRHYIKPLHWAVSTAAGWYLDMRWWRVRRYIRIPRGFARGDDGVVVACGPTFEPRGEAEKRVVEIVKAKLGLSDVQVGWKREGLHRYVQFTYLEPVPESVPFRRIRELIEAESTPGTVLVGLTRGGEAVWLDIDKKAPHVLMSSGTGGGKSAALVAITSQLMWHGAQVVVLDFKRMSHLWLRDLAGVRYARSIEEVHRTAVWLGDEVDRRTQAWDNVTLDDVEAGRVPTFPRLVILCEEMSSTMDYLRDHWTDIKESGDKPRSPAVTALAKVLNMGRVVRMNVLTVAQRAEANAVGNGAMRENYPVKILIDRYSKQTWNILAPECEYRPGLSHAGRAQMCLGATATELQIPWITEREAQRWVIDKRGMQPLVPQPRDAVRPGETVRDSPVQGTPGVTLWEASSDKGQAILPFNYERLKKAAQRDRVKGEFPDPIGQRGRFPEYAAADLRRWAKNRVRAMDSDEVADMETNEIDGVDRVDDIENEISEGAWLQGGASLRDSDRARLRAGFAPPDEHGCELWTGAVNGDGYGYLWVDGKAVGVHRLAYEDHTGPIPEGHTIDHRIGPGLPCTSKRCGAEGHLQAVTNERNVELRHERDKAQQGATT